MQAQNRQSRIRGRGVKGPQRQLLLVSCGRGLENNDASAALGTRQLHATSLLEALGRLKPEGIDIVLLGSEFGEEERTLFLLEAQRRGFAGPVLQSVSAAASALRSTTPSREPQNEDRRYDSVTPSFTEREQAVLGTR